jgi:hypothetical protein
MRRRVFSCLLVVSALVAGARSDYQNVKDKFQAIEKEKVKPGTRIAIPAQELNAYVQAELPTVAPEGIRNPRVELQGNNIATGHALIDFVKLRTAQGKPPNWFLRQLLEGEHEVAVTTRVRSGGGTATVDVQKVEVSGIPIEGAALDYLIQNYVLPRYPDAKIGRPFALNYRMDRLEVAPGVAYVVMKP